MLWGIINVLVNIVSLQIAFAVLFFFYYYAVYALKYYALLFFPDIHVYTSFYNAWQKVQSKKNIFRKNNNKIKAFGALY